MLISFLVFIFCLFLVLAAYLLATRSSDAKRTRLQQRLTEALLNSAHTDAILRQASKEELARIAITEGMRTMLADGIRKAVEGHTTIEEVMRVVPILQAGD